MFVTACAVASSGLSCGYPWCSTITWPDWSGRPRVFFWCSYRRCVQPPHTLWIPVEDELNAHETFKMSITDTFNFSLLATQIRMATHYVNLAPWTRSESKASRGV